MVNVLDYKREHFEEAMKLLREIDVRQDNLEMMQDQVHVIIADKEGETYKPFEIDVFKQYLSKLLFTMAYRANTIAMVFSGLTGAGIPYNLDEGLTLSQLIERDVDNKMSMTGAEMNEAIRSIHSLIQNAEKCLPTT